MDKIKCTKYAFLCENTCGLYYLGTDYTDYTEFIAICFRSLWLMR